MIYPEFVDHLVFLVSDLTATECFYSVLLGPPSHRIEDSIMYRAGDTLLFFVDTSDSEAYDKEKIGLNHLAFGVRSLDELRTIKFQLEEAGIANSGVKIDQYGLKEFIWLDDPDGMRIEFYLRPL